MLQKSVDTFGRRKILFRAFGIHVMASLPPQTFLSSLRDLKELRRLLPSVETLGYCRSSLRDWTHSNEVPKGTEGNSPPFQRWEPWDMEMKSPAGTTEGISFSLEMCQLLSWRFETCPSICHKLEIDVSGEPTKFDWCVPRNVMN